MQDVDVVSAAAPVHHGLVPREAIRALHAAVVRHRERTGEGTNELARRLGLTPQNFANQLRRLENGDAVEWDTVERIAFAIGYEVRLVKKEEP